MEEATTLVAEHEELAGWAAPPVELRGLIMRRLGHPEEGLKMLEAAQKIAADGNLPVIELRIQIEIINTLDELGEYPAALENARRAEALLTVVPKPSARISILVTVARLLIKLNELDAARVRLEEAQSIARELEDPSQHFGILYQLASLHFAEGDPAMAETYLNEALSLAQSLALSALTTGRALTKLGMALAAQGKAIEAEATYRTAIERAREGGNVAGIATAERLLGNLYEGIGRPSDAVVCYRSVTSAVGQTDVKEEIALATERLALLAAERGDYREAFEYHRRYHELRRELDALRHDNRIMVLRIRYRIDHLETLAAQERNEKERAHSALSSAHADVNALKVELIEHRQRFTALRARLQDLTRRSEEERNIESTRALRALARAADGDAATAHAQWQVNLATTNEDFHRRLRARHPDLTPALELLCDCLRSGMTTDSIASTLHITTSAISKRRYRLRRELRLEADVNLEKYLAEI